MELRHDQFENGKASDAPQRGGSSPDSAFPLVLAAAFAGAVVSWFIPVGLYETIVESVGLSEIIGSFAAPLGLKARLLISLALAIGCALLVALMLGVLSPKRAQRRPDAAARSPKSPKGPKTMTSQGSESEFPSEPARPKSFIDGIRAGLSRLPAPRRFQDDDAKASSDSFSERKRLRSGAAMTQKSDIANPAPIAAHAELGAPLPPLTPDICDAAPSKGKSVDAEAPASEHPATYHRQEPLTAVMPAAAGATVRDQARVESIGSSAIAGFDQDDIRLSAALANAKTQSDGSIEDLASRLARALGQGSGGLPGSDDEDEKASDYSSDAEPVAAPAPSEAREARLQEQRDAEAACEAARLAFEEAEEALDRAKSHVEEAREAARLAIEEAEHSVTRASERAGQARQRLASTETEAARVKQALEDDAKAAKLAERADASSRNSVTAKSEAPTLHDERDDMMDPALRDALRTLRRMTA